MVVTQLCGTPTEHSFWCVVSSETGRWVDLQRTGPPSCPAALHAVYHSVRRALWACTAERLSREGPLLQEGLFVRSLLLILSTASRYSWPCLGSGLSKLGFNEGRLDWKECFWRKCYNRLAILGREYILCICIRVCLWGAGRGQGGRDRRRREKSARY